MANIYILIVAAAAGLLSWLLVGRLRSVLLRYRLLDHPNERSSHKQPTPRGGGLALLFVILPSWPLMAYLAPPQLAGSTIAHWLLPAGALILAAISFVDDIRGLPQWMRFLAQATIVAALVQLLPGPVFQGLFGPTFDAVAAAIIWLWFINQLNFMDGIDGVAGVETIGIGIGLYTIGLVFMPATAAHGQALAITAAMVGFLVWNWHPARIFLGDVGSIPLGLLLGWLLLGLAANGQWAAALILPLYYLADATLTLLRRLLRGAAVWRAHREHCYQIAVQRGRSHAQVSGAVALVNAFLACLAFAGTATEHPPLVSLIILAAATSVAALMAWMVYGGWDSRAERS